MGDKIYAIAEVYSDHDYVDIELCYFELDAEGLRRITNRAKAFARFKKAHDVSNAMMGCPISVSFISHTEAIREILGDRNPYEEQVVYLDAPIPEDVLNEAEAAPETRIGSTDLYFWFPDTFQFKSFLKHDGGSVRSEDINLKELEEKMKEGGLDGDGKA